MEYNIVVPFGELNTARAIDRSVLEGTNPNNVGGFPFLVYGRRPVG